MSRSDNRATASALPPPAGALQALADSAPVMMWTSDAAGIIDSLQAGGQAVLAPGQRLGFEAWTGLIHADDRQRVIDAFRQAIAARATYQTEYRLLRSDGAVRWMLSVATPRLAADGQLDGFDGSVLDIDERHATREQLARSEAAHRLLAEHSSDLISQHAADGTYLYVSPSVRQMQGFEPAELLGRNALEFVHPDDAPHLGALLAPGGNGATVEFRKRHKDGHYLWVGARARAVSDPVTGAPSGMVVISRDIGAERAMKEALTRSETQFRSLCSLSSDWYWETDQDERFTFLSEGCAAADKLVGHRPIELALDPQTPDFQAYLGALARREPYRGLCYSARRADGSVGHTRVSAEPLYEDGVFIGYRGVATDITGEIERSERLALLAEENLAVVENSLDLNLVVDAAGRILRVNAAALPILGYAPQELVGQPYLRFVAPERRAGSEHRLDALRDDGAPLYDHENPWQRKDGSIVALSWSGRWSDDRSRLYCTARDVTERNRTRSALEASNRRLSTVLESIGDAFFTIDRGWRITYANQVFADFIGRKRERLVGSTLWSAVPDVLESAFLSHYRAAMESGVQASFEGFYEPRRAWVEVRVYPHEDGLSIFFSDVTERREAANALWLSEQRFREVVEMNPAGYLLTDARGAVVETNSALSALCGYERGELAGMALTELFPTGPLNPAELEANPANTMNGVEARLRHRGGHPVYVLVNANIRRDGADKVLSVTAFLTDISVRKRFELDLKKQATHDVLTGLPNRAFLDQRVPEILQYAARGQVNAVLMLDLDGFKRVNDTLGHAGGDLLLQQIAHRLRQHVRQGDLVARLGGDEFVVVAQVPGADKAAAIAAQLVAAVAEPVIIDGAPVKVGASIGISVSPDDGSTKDALLERADAAMYRVKTAGRNGYCFYDPAAAGQTG
jgi:diguanylate cyclase (GGDEF)-like protein/PAS domain S-box-containing protein